MSKAVIGTAQRATAIDIEKTSTAIDIEKIKALGNMDRVKILGILMKKGPMSWTELQNELKVNPNTLTFHLSKLVRGELIERKVVENKKRRPSTQYQILREGKNYYNANIKSEA